MTEKGCESRWIFWHINQAWRLYFHISVTSGSVTRAFFCLSRKDDRAHAYGSNYKQRYIKWNIRRLAPEASSSEENPEVWTSRHRILHLVESQNFSKPREWILCGTATMQILWEVHPDLRVMSRVVGTALIPGNCPSFIRVDVNKAKQFSFWTGVVYDSCNHGYKQLVITEIKLWRKPLVPDTSSLSLCCNE